MWFDPPQPAGICTQPSFEVPLSYEYPVNADQIVPVTIEEPAHKLAWKDFRLALIGAGVLVLLIALSQWLWFLQPLRLVLGLAYVLFVPGYCLTAALFPRADDIDGIERIGLSLGLSVAWISVLALILDWLPWGLRLWPIVLGELASIAIFAGIALWRRSRLPAAEAYAPDLACGIPRPRAGTVHLVRRYRPGGATRRRCSELGRNHAARGAL